MGCLEIAVVAVVGLIFVSLAIVAIEIAVLGVLGAVVVGGIAFLIFGVSGLKSGVIVGFSLGVFAALSG